MQLIDLKRPATHRSANNKYSVTPIARVYCSPVIEGDLQTSTATRFVRLAGEIAAVSAFVIPWTFSLYIVYGLAVGEVQW